MAERKPRDPQREKDTKKRKRKDDDKPDKAIRKAEKLREKLRKAEEAVAKAKAKLDSTAANETLPKRNLGIDYDSDDSAGQSGDNVSSPLAESSSDVSTDSESDSSSSSGGSSDDDAPPEEESSAKRPVKVHLPNRKAVQATTTRPRRDKGKEAPKRVTLRERVSPDNLHYHGSDTKPSRWQSKSVGKMQKSSCDLSKGLVKRACSSESSRWHTEGMHRGKVGC